MADAWEQVEVPLPEDSESYDVQILDGATVKRTLTATTTSVLYTAAQQAADWGAPLGPVRRSRSASSSSQIASGAARLRPSPCSSDPNPRESPVVFRRESSFSGWLPPVDILLTPIMHIANFPAEDLGPDNSMPLRHTTFTAPFNQSGHPALTICGGFDAQGLPIGIQLVGHRFDDIRLIRLAVRLEERLRRDVQRAPRWPLNHAARKTEPAL